MTAAVLTTALHGRVSVKEVSHTTGRLSETDDPVSESSSIDGSTELSNLKK